MYLKDWVENLYRYTKSVPHPIRHISELYIPFDYDVLYSDTEQSLMNSERTCSVCEDDSFKYPYWYIWRRKNQFSGGSGGWKVQKLSWLNDIKPPDSVSILNFRKMSNGVLANFNQKVPILGLNG